MKIRILHILVTYLLVYQVVTVHLKLDRITINKKLRTKENQNKGSDVNANNQNNSYTQNLITNGNPSMDANTKQKEVTQNQAGTGHELSLNGGQTQVLGYSKMDQDYINLIDI